MTSSTVTQKIYLEGPGLSSPVVVNGSGSNSVNGILEFATMIPDVRYLEFGWAPTDAWYLHSGGWTSPPLVCLAPVRSTKGGLGTCTLKGQDLATYLMTAEGLSLPTMHNMFAKDVLNAICSRAMNTVYIITPSPPPPAALDTAAMMAAIQGFVNGVTSFSAPSQISLTYVGGTPLDNMRIEEYDMKGGTLADHFTGILRDAACNYRVNATGGFDIFKTQHDAELINYVSAGAEWAQEYGHVWTQVWCRKQSKARGLFGFPATAAGLHTGELAPLGLKTISSVTVQPGGTAQVAYIALYTGKNGSGQCCGYYAIDPAFDITGNGYAGVSSLIGPIVSGIAQSVVWATEPLPANVPYYVVIVINGKPPGTYEYDPSFTTTFPPDILVTDPVTQIVSVAGDTTDPISGLETSTGAGEGDHAARQRHLIVSSSLWPTQAWLESNNIPQQMLWEGNKGNNTVSRDVEFDPVTLMTPGKVGAADLDGPRARYDNVSFTCGSDGMPSMKMKGFVIPW